MYYNHSQNYCAVLVFNAGAIRIELVSLVTKCVTETRQIHHSVEKVSKRPKTHTF